ncbi:hypothetical protein SNE40_011308 [Patella caerulea]|uniref:UDP-sugar transporter protein SLC35A4 n=1 Tax=Patella caerulea TaxID=87958 RepID=A0AAN8JRM7_PATCE
MLLNIFQKYNNDLPVYIQDVNSSYGKESKTIMKITWLLMLILEICLYSSYSPLVHICQVDGEIPFSSASLVLFTEIFKLGISVMMYIPEVIEKGIKIPSISFFLPLCVPAILYTCNNNISVHMQQEMDPTTYQVLSNLKIASTAVLYRIIMKRKLSRIKWLSLGLLTLAGVIDSFSGNRNIKLNDSIYEIHVTAKGLLMMFTYCFISGLSGVYTEYIFKRNLKCSIHLQNIFLYVVGIILNGSMWQFKRINAADYLNDDSDSLLRGFTVYTWIIVLSQAVNGLIMSVIMKYGSNITRLFIISCAMMMTTVFSILIFNIQLNTLFVCALILVLVALVLYHQSA